MQKNNKLQYKSAFTFLTELIKPHKKWYLLASLASIVLAVFELIQAKLSQLLIDNSILGKINLIVISIFSFSIILIFHAFFEYIKMLCSAKLSTSAGKDLKQKICHILLYAKYKDMTNVQAGDILKTVNVDTENVCSFLEGSLIDLFSQLIMAFFALIYLLYINPSLAMITFIYTPIGMFFTLTLNKKMKNLYIIEENKSGKALSFIEQLISQIPVIKSFIMEKQLRTRLYNMYRDIGNIQKDISVWNALMQPACSSTSYIPRIVYLIYAGKLVIENNMSIGTLIAVFELLNFIIGPTVYFPFLLNSLNKSIASINRIEKIYSMKLEEVKNCENSKLCFNSISSYTADEIEKYKNLDNTIKSNILLDKSKYYQNIDIMKSNVNKIELLNVNFSYDDNAQIIKNFSFLHEGNGIIALCGKSGSGKTTLIDLLSGLYSQSSGEIKLSSPCSVVTQDTYIFIDTLFNNIHMAKPSSASNEVISSIQLAGLDVLVEKLEFGHNTMIGDGVRKLSGGEKQRVSLARAILSDSPIWLLDEPTSSLDIETEKIIIDVIKKKSYNHLIIIAAHRQSLIDIADRRIELV